MKINYLVLNNFRQFVGEQKIVFSTSEDKKVTIVIADSGFGKTTMIQSFSWIFYGECKYKSPLNDSIKKSLAPYEQTTVSCSVNLSHGDSEYTITRTQRFQKINIKIEAESSTLVIDQKNPDGTTTQMRGREADKKIKELMPRDLFPYFFLEGENLSKVGDQMAKGKSGSTNEFVKAVKGLLGFNYLYEAEKHLNLVTNSYQTEIKANSNDHKLNEILARIERAEATIQSTTERINTIIEEIEYNTQKRDDLSDKLLKLSGVAEKQRRTIKLTNECNALRVKINDQKRYIFKRFSMLGFNFIMQSLLVEAKETLANSDALDKGIPGINVSAVEYMFENHKCICGNELVEGSKEWEILTNWIKYLPPNNIGHEISKFNSEISFIEKNGTSYWEEFRKARRDLNELIASYNEKVEEKHQLDEEIGGVHEDVSALKFKEQEYSRKIIELEVEKRTKEETRERAIKDKELAEKEQKGYGFISTKITRLTQYKEQSELLRLRIKRFCDKKEAEKREALQLAINEIFSDFYSENVQFLLDPNYVVQIRTPSAELSEDFVSGGQQVALALSFIGAIIKLHSQKDISVDDDDIGTELSNEVYPLILDAPTSNFGMKQMNSFAEIMPKVTNQIIVFINDKDGPILKKLMQRIIDSEWSLIKEDTYHVFLKEGV